MAGNITQDPLYLTLSLEEESILVGADVLEILGRP